MGSKINLRRNPPGEGSAVESSTIKTLGSRSRGMYRCPLPVRVGYICDEVPLQEAPVCRVVPPSPFRAAGGFYCPRPEGVPSRVCGDDRILHPSNARIVGCYFPQQGGTGPHPHGTMEGGLWPSPTEEEPGTGPSPGGEGPHPVLDWSCPRGLGT
jgi:hypothetical protein